MTRPLMDSVISFWSHVENEMAAPALTDPDLFTRYQAAIQDVQAKERVYQDARRNLDTLRAAFEKAHPHIFSDIVNHS